MSAEDWEATTIIYGLDDDDDDDTTTTTTTTANSNKITTILDNSQGLLRGSIEIECSLHTICFCRQIRPFDPQKPRYRFWVLQPPQWQPKQETKTKGKERLAITTAARAEETGQQEECMSLRFRLIFWCQPSNIGDTDNEKDEDELSLYDRVEIKLLSPYPHSFPQELKFKWLEWLTQQANVMLQEEQISYSVCNFVQHKALDFFPRLWETNNHYNNTSHILEALQDCDLIEFQDEGPAFYDVPTLATYSTVKRLLPLQRQYPNGAKELQHDTSKLSRKEQTLLVPLIVHWKQWLPIECPICFDTVPSWEAVIVSCDHGFCKSCLTTYLRIKADEIHSENAKNPFVCPLNTCRQGMKIKKCVQQFLTEDLMDKVKAWYKDIQNPPSYMLDRCLKRDCHNTVLRKEAVDSYIMSCETCQGRWCELCLQRAPKAKQQQSLKRSLQGTKPRQRQEQLLEDDHFATPGLCKAEECVAFCERYLAAGAAAKQKCETKWPWIKHYAKSRIHDESIHDWVRSNAQTCPGCKSGIERLEGCFHMSCQCGTHFCYECGEEIFYPFYGTHHCWEREQRLQETYQAYEQFYQQQAGQGGGGGGDHVFEEPEDGGLYLGRW